MNKQNTSCIYQLYRGVFILIDNEQLLKFNSEYSLTSVVNKMTGLEAFVISTAANQFQFNIMGYCFTTERLNFYIDNLPKPSSDVFYLQIHVPISNSLLVDKEGKVLCDRAIINLDEGTHNLAFSYSIVPTYDPVALGGSRRVTKLIDTNIVEAQKDVTTYVFTLLRCVRQGGDDIQYTVPKQCMITDGSMLHLEVFPSGSFDDGEL